LRVTARRALWLVVLTIGGCSGDGAHAGSPPKTKPATTTSTTTNTSKGSAALNKLEKPADVKSLLALRALGRSDLLSQLQLAPGDVKNDVSYQKMKGVARAHNGAVYPAHFYLRGDELAVVYIGDRDFLSALTPAAIRKELGGDGTRLRSRAGKTSNQYVYPESGFAYSETGGALDFVEVFAPRSLDAYRETIYEDPGAFTK
jgi:hypothetical protein